MAESEQPLEHQLEDQLQSALSALGAVLESDNSESAGEDEDWLTEPLPTCNLTLRPPWEAPPLRAAQPELNREAQQSSRAVESAQNKQHLQPTKIRSTLPMDDPEFREIAADFVLGLGVKLQQMRQALGDGNLAELAQLAHWLKGSGGTCGFPQFSQPAKELEQAAKSFAVRMADETLQRIEQIAELLEAPAEYEYQ
jgi:HPt (histidine-containing phosphotransfer) domain-containing protein